MNDPYFFMTVLAPSFVLLPVFAALYRYRSLSAAGRALLYYLLIEAVILATSSVLAYYKLPNTGLYHVSTVVEMLLLLFFFSHVFSNRKMVVYIKCTMLLFPVLALLNTLFLQTLNNFNSHTISLQYGLVILLCFVYWLQPAEEPVTAWAQQPLNWISSGMLLYFSGSFVLLAFSAYINSHFSKQTNIVIWNVHAALAMLMYILMAIGFLKYKRHE